MHKKTLVIFDNSCEEILQSKAFSILVTAGNHKDLSVIFIKDNLYQQENFCVTIVKNTTHILLTTRWKTTQTTCNRDGMHQLSFYSNFS